MNNIFTNIVKGITPIYKVAENKEHIAFLDIMPLKIGHTLVIPKKKYNKFTQMKNSEFLLLMKFVYLLSKSIEKTILCNRIGISIIGFEISHVHIHIIPINKENEINFSNPRQKYSKKLMILVSNTIRYFFNKNYYN